MALSPAHAFGQAIGNLVEEMMDSPLRAAADTHGLYLDRHGLRNARKGKKVTWTDSFGNGHDLDYVLERGGSDNQIGEPVAFIEVAWRRYTKHSRNKAQEIQGALLPLASTYYISRPFLGAVIAGEFTSGALTQMKSSGFKVLHFLHQDFINAFGMAGIGIEFDQATPDSEFSRAKSQLDDLSADRRSALINALMKEREAEFDTFMSSLDESLSRALESIDVIPLFGRAHQFPSVRQAADFLDRFAESEVAELQFQRFEVVIRYSNGDKIDAVFQDKADAISFVKRY